MWLQSKIFSQCMFFFFGECEKLAIPFTWLVFGGNFLNLRMFRFFKGFFCLIWYYVNWRELPTQFQFSWLIWLELKLIDQFKEFLGSLSSLISLLLSLQFSFFSLSYSLFVIIDRFTRNEEESLREKLNNALFIVSLSSFLFYLSKNINQ